MIYDFRNNTNNKQIADSSEVKHKHTDIDEKECLFPYEAIKSFF